MGAPRLVLLCALLPGLAAAQPGLGEPTTSVVAELPAGLDPEQTRIMRTIPVEHQESVALAEQFGRLLLAHDRAAWLATDEVGVATLRKLEDVEGWFVTDLGDLQYRVTWFGPRDGERAALLDIEVDLPKWDAIAGTERKHKKGRPLTADELALTNAQVDATQREWLRCAAHYNTAAFWFTDHEGKRRIHVYLMPADTDNVTLQMGGDHRFRYEADGRTLVDHYANSRGCLRFQRNKDAVSLGLTHLNSATPTELHFFRMLNYRVPLTISTTQNGILWAVEKEGIRIVKDGKPAGDAPPPPP